MTQKLSSKRKKMIGREDRPKSKKEWKKIKMKMKISKRVKIKEKTPGIGNILAHLSLSLPTTFEES